MQHSERSSRNIKPRFQTTFLMVAALTLAATAPVLSAGRDDQLPQPGADSVAPLTGAEPVQAQQLLHEFTKQCHFR